MIMHHLSQIGGNTLDSRNARNNGLAARNISLRFKCDWRSGPFTAYGLQHFRTPSPCGRHVIPSRMSLTNFFGAKSLIWQGFANTGSVRDLRLILRGGMTPLQARKTTEHKGKLSCSSKRGRWRWRPLLDCPHVATISQNKVLSVQVPARRQPSFWTARPLLAQLSGRQAICSTVRPTRASVTNASRSGAWAPTNTQISPGSRRDHRLVRSSRGPVLYFTHSGQAPNHPRRTA